MGAPDRPAAVRPFLRNLFRDPAILRVGPFLRPFLARLLARVRLRPAERNYALIKGRSPLLEITRAQAIGLAHELQELSVRSFVVMRYWHPFSEAAARAVQAWHPDQVVLLPLYPQYCSATSGSSLVAWREAAVRAGLIAETLSVCCFGLQRGYIRALAASVRAGHVEASAALSAGTRLRVLFSAHGLPVSVITSGDPYQWHVEQTVGAVLSEWGNADVDWIICYQSRATPQQWLKPSTSEEIERAGREGVAVLVVPIAFVSDHSETLVELDVEYRDLAEQVGLPGYFRVPALNVMPEFLRALAEIVRQAHRRAPGTVSDLGHRVCPQSFRLCPCALADDDCDLGHDDSPLGVCAMAAEVSRGP